MSKYKQYNADQLEELYSNYLLNSWSYSKVTSFARNEKAFEMAYIFGVYGKSSATTIAGQAYHHALKYFFDNKKEGKELDLVDIEQSAFDYINEVPANHWKIQKTTPTVEYCILKATATVSSLLKNFIKEKAIYQDDVKSIVDVEVYGDEFLTVNGVDIPLPCHLKIDLVLELNDGRYVIVDHKSKSTYSPDDEIALSIGIQAITYILGYEAMKGTKVNEVWFVENKYSQNKNGDPQLQKFCVSVDGNTRRLYESLLYEPLKRMLEAISNPDYVYLINESDNFVDKAELYDFWCRTMICDVEDFNVEESKKELVSKRLKKIKDSSVEMISPSVIRNFKANAEQFIQYDLSNKNMTQEQKIEHALRSFGVMATVAHTFSGYSSDTYLLNVSAGVKIASIISRKMDIANQLDVTNVRMPSKLVMHENKSYLAIEVSKKRSKDLIFDASKIQGSKIPIGEDNYGNVIYWDIDNPATPHILTCGATGSGKSVFLISLLEYAKKSGIHNIVILDPKREFVAYSYKGCVVANDIEEIEALMAKMVEFMNDKVRMVGGNGSREKTLIIFDEFADALSQARRGKQLNGDKSLEENLRVLLQKGRSLGIRVIAATQRASVKVITGDAKVNFPVQVCFRVPKEVDSKVVLDEGGAESLSGLGDGLIKSPEYLDTVRFQAYYKKQSEAQPA